MKSKIFRLLMVALGFGAYTSCDGPDMYGCPMPAPEYGCPYAEYNFDVDVVDSENDAPIEGIRVSVIEKYSEQHTDTLAVGLTQPNGKVRLQVGRIPTDKHTLVADDVDSEANGSFDSASVVVNTNGDGPWYEGQATEEVTIKLNKKSE
jgi:putative lipoprotein (rSAM/lipoprotein system)